MRNALRIKNKQQYERWWMILILGIHNSEKDYKQVYELINNILWKDF